MLFAFDGYHLDDGRHLLSGPDGAIHVEPQVFGVLRHLLLHRDRVVPKEELLDELWGDRFVSESTLTSRIKAARKAIGDDGTAQRLIGTVHGIGYRFVGAVDARADGTDGEDHGGRGEDDGARAGAPGRPGTGPARPSSLPALRTTLIGRDGTLAAVAASIERAPLTTLIGPGGVGKTSVALAVAHGGSRRWHGGIVFVDLVPARTDDDVLVLAARGLGVEGDASRSGTELARHLGDRSVLVVMDNCEHVVDAAAALVHDLLGSAASTHVLATSREPLGLADEHLVPIEPLGADAAELFVARARQSEPRVEWDAADSMIVDVCTRLDGLPLALELAAGQLRRWSLPELHKRLGDAPADVAARPGRRASRHQTMHDAVGWSYSLLEADEQRLLRSLSVFPARFDLDAVHGLGPVLDVADVDETLAALVDKSLVVRDPGTTAYRLLETIRAFAIDELRAADEHAAAFERHRRWMVERATTSSRMDRWASGRLAARQRDAADDARQAFWASLEGGHLTDATELAIARAFLWRNSIGCAEGHTWLDALDAQDPGSDPGLAAWVAVLRADIALGDGAFVEMIDAADRAAALAADLDPVAHAIALQISSLRHLLDPAAADDALAEVLARSTDERLRNLVRVFGVVAHLGDPDRADLHGRLEALEAGCSDDGYERFILNWTSWMYGLARRDPGRAERSIADQYVYLRHIGLTETWLTSFSLAMTQMIDGVSGREELARALEIADREGYRIEGDCMLALAYAEVCGGDATTAAELLGLARTRRFNATANHVLHGIVLDPVVRGELEPAAFRDALARGRDRSVTATLAAYGIRARSDAHA